MSVDERNVNLPLSYWSSQLFHLSAPPSTDVSVLLLNQPIGVGEGDAYFKLKR